MLKLFFLLTDRATDKVELVLIVSTSGGRVKTTENIQEYWFQVQEDASAWRKAYKKSKETMKQSSLFYVLYRDTKLDNPTL